MQGSMIIHPDELSKAWIDRMADAGIKTLGIHPCGGHLAVQSLEDLLARMKTSDYRELIDYAHGRGLAVEYELHAAGYLLPRDMFGAHPDYFRMNENGERINDWNLCVSNPDAVDLFVKRAAELAHSLYGSSRDFYFWMDDGHDFHCHCPKCRELSPSDQQLLVVNRMLKEIRKSMPDARMAYLAYIDSMALPTKIAAEDGVFLEYAPMSKYTATGENAAALIAQEKEMIVPLIGFFGRGPKKVLEYWYDNSLFSRWKKPPLPFVLNEEAMRTDVAEYLQMGFDNISTFACFLGKDYEELHGDVDITPFASCVFRKSSL